MIDLEETKRLAKDATSGQWYIRGIGMWMYSSKDAAFIAHMNPSHTLELVAEIERLREELKWRKGVHNITGEVDGLKLELARAKQEAEKWRDEYQNLCKFANDFEEQLFQTKEEIKRLRDRSELSSTSVSYYKEALEKYVKDTSQKNWREMVLALEALAAVEKV
jgi:uncharacterized coiled-coil DUF342 family protein